MIQLEDFGTPDAPNIDAAHVGLVALMALQKNRRDLAERLLGEGTIRDWYWAPEEFWEWRAGRDDLPQTALFQQGTKWMLVVRGTQNASQWRQHITGAPGLEFSDVPGYALAHGFHVRMARQLDEWLEEKLPSNKSAMSRFFVCGHSYGGAIAQLLGFIWKSRYPSLNVQIATWGGPRCVSVGYEGPAPNAYFRFATAGDLVPLVPFGSLTVLDIGGFLSKTASWANKGLKWGGTPLVPDLARYAPRAWRHYGVGFLFSRHPERIPPQSFADAPEVQMRQYTDSSVPVFAEVHLVANLLWVSNHLTDSGYFPAWRRWVRGGRKPWGNPGKP